MNDNNYTEISELDEPITEREILTAIDRLKRNKVHDWMG